MNRILLANFVISCVVAHLNGALQRIQRRLAQLGRLDVLKAPVQIRNYATDDEVSK